MAETVFEGERWTVEGVLPLIKDARMVERAISSVSERSVDGTSVLQRVLTDLYAEIGEKVADAVEVSDANA